MKLTIVLPDGHRQPIEAPEHTTLRRLLPALVEKVNLLRRDEMGTAVAYYATHHTESDLVGVANLSELTNHHPIPDDQSFSDLGIQDNDVLLLHPVVVADPHEAIEPEPDLEAEEPILPRSRRIRRQRERSSRFRQVARIGCVLTVAALCCIPVTFFSWLTYAIGQEVRSQSSPSVATTEVVTIDGNEWDFVVTDAVYNTASERLVMISADPDRLHIYDPGTGLDTQMSLTDTPTAVSVNANGGLAVVAHDGMVSLVNLETQTVSQTISIEATIHDAVVAENGWVYLTASDNNKDSIYGLEIVSGDEYEIVVPHNNATRLLQLAPDGRSLYATTNGPVPGRLEKIDIAQGQPRFLYDSGEGPDSCGQVWLAEDGRFAFTGCGHIWGLADRKQDDMVLRGNFFTGTERILALTHSAAAGRIGLISQANDSQILLFDDEGFNILTTRSLLPSMHGRFVFINAAGNQYYAITQTETGQYSLTSGDL